MFESDLIEELQFIRTELVRLNDFLSHDFKDALSKLTEAVRERDGELRTITSSIPTQTE